METTENAAPLSSALSSAQSSAQPSSPATSLSTAVSDASSTSTALSTQDYWTRMQDLRDELAALQRSAPAC